MLEHAGASLHSAELMRHRCAQRSALAAVTNQHQEAPVKRQLSIHNTLLPKWDLPVEGGQPALIWEVLQLCQLQRNLLKLLQLKRAKAGPYAVQ